MADDSRQKKQSQADVDPNEGDAILRRMLHMKPKQHKEMIKQRRAGEKPQSKGKHK